MTPNQAEQALLDAGAGRSWAVSQVEALRRHVATGSTYAEQVNALTRWWAAALAAGVTHEKAGQVANRHIIGGTLTDLAYVLDRHVDPHLLADLTSSSRNGVAALLRAGLTAQDLSELVTVHGWRVSDLRYLLDDGISPRQLLDMARIDADLPGDAMPLRRVGLTWDDIDWLVRTNAPLRRTDTLEEAVVHLKGPHAPSSLAELTDQERRLTALLWLTADLNLPACMVISTASANQRWTAELVSLLVDASGTYRRGHTHEVIVTARALDGEARSGPITQPGRWQHPITKADDTALDDATKAWIAGATSLKLTLPNEPWGLTGLDWLTAALAFGVSETDLRTLATEYRSGLELGLPAAAAILATGTTVTTATTWTRSGIDPLTCALLTHWGMSETDAITLAKGEHGLDAGRHACTLLAAGASSEQALRLHRQLEGAPAKSRSGTFLPPSIAVLEALDAAGLRYAALDDSLRDAATLGGIPTDVLVTAAKLSTMTYPRSEPLGGAAALAVASAITGMDWTVDVQGTARDVDTPLEHLQAMAAQIKRARASAGGRVVTVGAPASGTRVHELS